MMQHQNEREEDDDEVPILQDLDLISIGERSDDNVGVVDDDITKNNLNDDLPANNNTNQHHQQLPRVPVTILTGFLGSGKTTLVKHILSSTQHNKRIAVIENEFGGGTKESNTNLIERLGLTVNDISTLSVETMIARDGTDGLLTNLSDFIELSNGCVCCTVKDSLVETLENLLSKRTDLDYVIIEASGMADPGPVASIFWLDEALNSRIQLDGIVTCVDAINISDQLVYTSSSITKSTMSSEGEGQGGDEAARQVAFADRIIVNKVDLLLSRRQQQQKQHENKDSTAAAKTTSIESVIQQIKSINPTAPIKTTTYSKIDNIDWLLDANCFDAERVKDVESAFQQSFMKGSSSSTRFSCNDPLCNENHVTQPQAMFCGLCSESSSSPLPESVLSSPPPLRSDTTRNRQHQHTNAVGTIALFSRGSIDLHKLNSWLASILWPNQDESDKVLRARLENDLESSGDGDTNSKIEQKRQQKIYRIKGILSVKHAVDDIMGEIIPQSNDWVDDGLETGLVISSESDAGLDKRRYIVQAVNDLWDVLPASNNLCWDDNDTRCCKIIIIGKWLNEDELQKGFDQCFHTEESV